MKRVTVYIFFSLTLACLSMSCSSLESVLDGVFEDSGSSGDSKTERHPSGNVDAPRGNNLSQGQPSVDVSVYRQLGMDKRVKEVPEKISRRIFSNPESAIEDLVFFLVENEPDPFVRVKLLHDWIADNISYDTESFFSGNISGVGWVETLRNRRSVCEGYSGLFQKMCDIAEIPAETIHGYARGYGFDLFAPENFSESNHAWNAVDIDGYWYLVDCTWDAGHVNGTTYEKDYSAAYLFIQPDQAMYTHYPEDPSWQLLDTPMKPEEAALLPRYDGRYFLYGFEPVDGIRKSNSADTDFGFSIDLPPGYILVADVADTSGMGYDKYCLVQKEGGRAFVGVKFPKPGNWTVRLFASGGGSDLYDHITEFGVTAEAASSGTFPVLYTSFFEDECRLYGPIDNPLRIGENVDFKLKLPGYKKVYIKAGESVFDLTPEADGFFSGRFVIPASTELRIFGSKDVGARSYTGLAGYEISR